MTASPERRAWRILAGAFLIFLLLCGASIYVVYYYAFESVTDLEVSLQAARGTVRLNQPASADEIAVTTGVDGLLEGADVTTDATSQGVITFNDPQNGDPVASVVLFHDSEVKVITSQTPRFGVNQSPARIEIEGQTGRIEVLIFDTIPQGVRFTLHTDQATAVMDQPGRYNADITAQDVRFTTYSGHAVITGTHPSATLSLGEGKRTTVTEAATSLSLMNSETSLITNSDFTQDYTVGWREPALDMGDPSNTLNVGNPPGALGNVTFDGRTTIVLDRTPPGSLESGASPPGHGQTGLIQTVNADISDMSFFEIRATFYVDAQTVSDCGTVGSECAMMIRIFYKDSQGVDREYLQGFYVFHNPLVTTPDRCDTCAGPNERIDGQTWYTYRSGNLLALLPEELRPAYIKELWFYSSGWAYRVYVSEMDLLTSP